MLFHIFIFSSEKLLVEKEQENKDGEVVESHEVIERLEWKFFEEAFPFWTNIASLGKGESLASCSD